MAGLIPFAELKSYPGIAPQSLSGAAAVNGTGIQKDYQNESFRSALIVLNLGAVTGAPTSFSVTVKVQDSADNITFADYTQPAWEGASSVVGSAANTIYQLPFDLRGTRQYVRVVATPAFVGGTTPAVLADVVVAASDATVRPAANY